MEIVIGQPTSAEFSTNINDIMNNPGFSNISKKIFWILNHNTQLSSRFVCKSWKNHIDSPYFWIKKLNLKGQTNELENAWIGLLQRIGEGSSLGDEITECLMKFHQDYENFRKPNLDGMLPIHLTSRYGYLNISKFIVSFSKDPNPPRKDGFTPLHMAAAYGKIEVFKFLVTMVENLFPFDSIGWTPIHLASKYGHTEIFKILMAKIENPNLPTANGWTPLHLAARNGVTEIVQILMTKIENPNLPKPDGWTPLHLASFGGHAKIVKILASIVENPNEPLPLPDGRTPVKIAADANHSPEVMLQLLIAMNGKLKTLQIAHDLN